MFDASLRSKTDEKGVLRLEVQTGLQNTPVDVKLHVTKPMTKEAYLKFVEETYGSIEDPTFVRQDQGEVPPPKPLD